LFRRSSCALLHPLLNMAGASEDGPPSSAAANPAPSGEPSSQLEQKQGWLRFVKGSRARKLISSQRKNILAAAEADAPATTAAAAPAGSQPANGAADGNANADPAAVPSTIVIDRIDRKGRKEHSAALERGRWLWALLDPLNDSIAFHPDPDLEAEENEVVQTLMLNEESVRIVTVTERFLAARKKRSDKASAKKGRKSDASDLGYDTTKYREVEAASDLPQFHVLVLRKRKVIGVLSTKSDEARDTWAAALRNARNLSIQHSSTDALLNEWRREGEVCTDLKCYFEPFGGSTSVIEDHFLAEDEDEDDGEEEGNEDADEDDLLETTETAAPDDSVFGLSKRRSISSMPSASSMTTTGSLKSSQDSVRSNGSISVRSGGSGSISIRSGSDSTVFTSQQGARWAAAARRLEPLLKIVLEDTKRRRLTLGSVLSGSTPTLLLLLRHYGCVVCRSVVGKLMAHQDVLGRLGVQVITVAYGTPTHVKNFREEFPTFRGQTLLDPNRALFDALALRRGVKAAFARQSLVVAKQALGDGYRFGAMTGDSFQLGGAFVVTRQHGIVWSHREAWTGDVAPTSVVLSKLTQAVRSLDDFSFEPDMLYPLRSLVQEFEDVPLPGSTPPTTPRASTPESAGESPRSGKAKGKMPARLGRSSSSSFLRLKRRSSSKSQADLLGSSPPASPQKQPRGLVKSVSAFNIDISSLDSESREPSVSKSLAFANSDPFASGNKRWQDIPIFNVDQHGGREVALTHHRALSPVFSMFFLGRPHLNIVAQESDADKTPSAAGADSQVSKSGKKERKMRESAATLPEIDVDQPTRSKRRTTVVMSLTLPDDEQEAERASEDCLLIVRSTDELVSFRLRVPDVLVRPFVLALRANIRGAGRRLLQRAEKKLRPWLLPRLPVGPTATALGSTWKYLGIPHGFPATDPLDQVRFDNVQQRLALFESSGEAAMAKQHKVTILYVPTSKRDGRKSKASFDDVVSVDHSEIPKDSPFWGFASLFGRPDEDARPGWLSMSISSRELRHANVAAPTLHTFVAPLARKQDGQGPPAEKEGTPDAEKSVLKEGDGAKDEVSDVQDNDGDAKGEVSGVQQDDDDDDDEDDGDSDNLDASDEGLDGNSGSDDDDREEVEEEEEDGETSPETSSSDKVHQKRVRDVRKCGVAIVYNPAARPLNFSSFSKSLRSADVVLEVVPEPVTGHGLSDCLRLGVRGTLRRKDDGKFASILTVDHVHLAPELLNSVESLINADSGIEAAVVSGDSSNSRGDSNSLSSGATAATGATQGDESRHSPARERQRITTLIANLDTAAAVRGSGIRKARSRRIQHTTLVRFVESERRAFRQTRRAASKAAEKLAADQESGADGGQSGSNSGAVTRKAMETVRSMRSHAASFWGGDKDDDDLDFSLPLTRVLGAPLARLTRAQGAAYPLLKVPVLFLRLCDHLTREEGGGLAMQGLFRTQPDDSILAELIGRLNQGVLTTSDGLPDDIPLVATLLKRMLRELPEPLIPANLYERAIAHPQDGDSVSALLKDPELPPENLAMLELIASFLRHVAKHEEKTLMGAHNLALVFAPCLLRTPQDVDPVTAVGNAASEVSFALAFVTEAPVFEWTDADARRQAIGECHDEAPDWLPLQPPVIIMPAKKNDG
jgi:RhoGAP domain/AhpC/TSA antioxidant enzyme